MKSVTVVTPTTGDKKLFKNIQSVQDQTYENVTHLICVDGPEFLDAALEKMPRNSKVKLLALPENVGANNFYGHRIYAATSFLVNTDYICFLDQDNWYEPNHIETMVKTIEQNNLDWCFSLRNIYDQWSTFVCQDNCESLGKWPAWINEQAFHVDTSCYMMKREVATRMGGIWYGQWGQDRVVLQCLKQHVPNYDTTGKYTVNYMLGGNEGSVKEDFFLNGNQTMYSKYGNNYPWIQERIAKPAMEVKDDILVINTAQG